MPVSPSGSPRHNPNLSPDRNQPDPRQYVAGPPQRGPNQFINPNQNRARELEAMLSAAELHFFGQMLTGQDPLPDIPAQLPLQLPGSDSNIGFSGITESIGATPKLSEDAARSFQQERARALRYMGQLSPRSLISGLQSQQIDEQDIDCAPKIIRLLQNAKSVHAQIAPQLDADHVAILEAAGVSPMELDLTEQLLSDAEAGDGSSIKIVRNWVEIYAHTLQAKTLAENHLATDNPLRQQASQAFEDLRAPIEKLIGSKNFGVDVVYHLINEVKELKEIGDQELHALIDAMSPEQLTELEKRLIDASGFSVGSAHEQDSASSLQIHAAAHMAIFGKKLFHAEQIEDRDEARKSHDQILLNMKALAPHLGVQQLPYLRAQINFLMNSPEFVKPEKKQEYRFHAATLICQCKVLEATQLSEQSDIAHDLPQGTNLGKARERYDQALMELKELVRHAPCEQLKYMKMCCAQLFCPMSFVRAEERAKYFAVATSLAQSHPRLRQVTQDLAIRGAEELLEQVTTNWHPSIN